VFWVGDCANNSNNNNATLDLDPDESLNLLSPLPSHFAILSTSDPIYRFTSLGTPTSHPIPQHAIDRADGEQRAAR
jgi:hypothetical protein